MLFAICTSSARAESAISVRAMTMPPSWCLIINCRNWISASTLLASPQAPKFGVARHTVHQRHAICRRRHVRVAWHPRHPWPRRGLRQSPLLQPSHEDAALRTLSHDDVGRERSKLLDRRTCRARRTTCPRPARGGWPCPGRIRPPLNRRVACRAAIRSAVPRPTDSGDDEQAGGEHRQPTRDIGQRRRHDVLYYALRNTPLRRSAGFDPALTMRERTSMAKHGTRRSDSEESRPTRGRRAEQTRRTCLLWRGTGIVVVVIAAAVCVSTLREAPTAPGREDSELPRRPARSPVRSPTPRARRSADSTTSSGRTAASITRRFTTSTRCTRWNTARSGSPIVPTSRRTRSQTLRAVASDDFLLLSPYPGSPTRSSRAHGITS